MDKQVRPPVQDWARSEGISWEIRALHNTAMSGYMRSRTREDFNAILEILREARADIVALFADRGDEEENCCYPWCPDERDMCVPCEEDDDDGRTGRPD